MKKLTFLLIGAIVSLVCYAGGRPLIVEKWRGNSGKHTKGELKQNIEITTSLYPNTITVSFDDSDIDLNIEIYKQGEMIMEDNVLTKTSESVNYTIDTNEEPQRYRVRIIKNGKIICEDTVVIN